MDPGYPRMVSLRVRWEHRLDSSRVFFATLYRDKPASWCKLMFWFCEIWSAPCPLVFPVRCMSAMLVMDLFLPPTLPRTMSRLDVFEPKVSAHCQAKNCCKLECHSASFEISLDRSGMSQFQESLLQLQPDQFKSSSSGSNQTISNVHWGECSSQCLTPRRQIFVDSNRSN